MQWRRKLAYSTTVEKPCQQWALYISLVQAIQRRQCWQKLYTADTAQDQEKTLLKVSNPKSNSPLFKKQLEEITYTSVRSADRWTLLYFQKTWNLTARTTVMAAQSHSANIGNMHSALKKISKRHYQNSGVRNFFKLFASNTYDPTGILRQCLVFVRSSWKVNANFMSKHALIMKEEKYTGPQKNDLWKKSECVIHGHSRLNNDSRRIETYVNTLEYHVAAISISAEPCR